MGLLIFTALMVAAILALYAIMSSTAELMEEARGEVAGERAAHPCMESEVRMRAADGSDVCIPGRRP